MIKIKCVFPNNYYLLRKVNIKIKNEAIAQIGHKEVIELDVFEKLIKFNLDYHKTQIKFPNSKIDKYLIIYFNFRNYFPFSIIDIMFKNSLCAKFVDESEFNNFNESFYKEHTSEVITFNKTVIYTIIIGILISCQFLFFPFLNLNNSNSINNFSFFIGIASLIGFMLLIFNRKNITKKQYNIRALAFGILSILLLFYINIDTMFKMVSIILSFSIVIISIYYFKEKSP